MKKIDSDLLKYIDKMEIQEEELSKDELQRIQVRIEEKTANSNLYKKRKTFLKYTTSLAACFLIIVSFIVISPRLLHQDNTQLTNPITQCDSLEDTHELLGFQIITPTTLPSQYTLENILVIDSKLLELRYHSPSNNITYRMIKSTDYITGDYRTYERTYSKDLNGQHIELMGDSQGLNAVMWLNAPYSFYIYSTEAVSEEFLLELVNNINSQIGE